MTIIDQAAHRAASASGLTATVLEQPDGYDLPPQEEALFNAANYEVRRRAWKFAGTIFFDASDPDDVALWATAKPGETIVATVEMRLSGESTRYPEDKEGNPAEVTGERTLKIHTLYRS